MIDMGLQITHLGSGSRGNSTLLESDSCKVLIDCGFSLKQTEKRLSTIKIEPSSIVLFLLLTIMEIIQNLR